MKRELFRVLADHLRKLGQDPNRYLNMKLWADSCGTPACAIGEACTLPEFKGAGLELRKKLYIGYCPILTSDPQLSPFDAIAKVFDIPRGHAEMLFGDVTYPTRGYESRNVDPDLVADRLEQYAGLGQWEDES